MDRTEDPTRDQTGGGGECSGGETASRADQRRARVIETARGLFAQRGFHATGIAELARQSGVLVGQLYRDFACKEDIVAAIVERDIDEFLSDGALRDAIDRHDVPAVRQWIRDFMLCDGGACDEDRGLVAEIIAESTRNPRVSAITRGLEDRLREHLFRALVMLVPEPEKAERRDMLGEAILIVSGGIFHRRLVEGTVGDPSIVTAIIGFVDRELSLLMAAD